MTNISILEDNGNSNMSSSEGIDVVVSDELIERNFKTFRSYIETCVKVTDLIVFYDLFTTGRLSFLNPLDPTK